LFLFLKSALTNASSTHRQQSRPCAACGCGTLFGGFVVLACLRLENGTGTAVASASACLSGREEDEGKLNTATASDGAKPRLQFAPNPAASHEGPTHTNSPVLTTSPSKQAPQPSVRPRSQPTRWPPYRTRQQEIINLALSCASGPVPTELSTNLLRALEAVQITPEELPRAG
jgi:hypothetical protein